MSAYDQRGIDTMITEVDQTGGGGLPRGAIQTDSLSTIVDRGRTDESGGVITKEE